MSITSKFKKRKNEEKEGKLMALGLIIKTYADIFVKRSVVKRIAESGDEEMNSNHVFASYMYRVSLDEMMKNRKVSNTLQRLCYLDGYDKPVQIDLAEVEKLGTRLLDVITHELIVESFEKFKAGKEEAVRKNIENALKNAESFYGEEFEITTDENEFKEAYADENL